MKCQKCNNNEANTQLTITTNGVKKKIYLCSECASQYSLNSMFPFSSSDWFNPFFDMLSNHEQVLPKVKRCEKCGSSLQDIYSSGKTGCPECYEQFYTELMPIIRKIHGKTQHIASKSRTAQPETAAVESAPEDEITRLNRDLTDAVAEQNFELAAELRDQINALKEGNSDAK